MELTQTNRRKYFGCSICERHATCCPGKSTNFTVVQGCRRIGVRTGARYFDKLFYCECGTRAPAGGDHNDVSTAPGYAATLSGSGGSQRSAATTLALQIMIDRKSKIDDGVSPSFSLTVMA